MSRVILFTSSSISLSLIISLIKKEVLAGVVISSVYEDGMDKMIQTLMCSFIPVLHYSKEDDEKFLEDLKALDGDVGISFIYNHIFSKEVFSSFSKGCFNIHPSPLPKYRGYHPLFWQIFNGERSSALTIHTITEEIDCGDIALQKEFNIEKSDNLGNVVEKISEIVPSFVEEFLEKLEVGEIEFQKQSHDFSYFKKPSKEELTINWQKDSAKVIERKVKATSPYIGGVVTQIRGFTFKVLAAKALEEQFEKEVGEIISNESFIVATKDGSISLEVIGTEQGNLLGTQFAKALDLKIGERLENID